MRFSAKEADDQFEQYRQQTTAIVAKHPQLKNEAYASLQDPAMKTAQYKLDLRRQTRQERAQADVEQRLGLTATHDAQTEATAKARLALDTKKYNQKVAEAKARGARPNASLIRHGMASRPLRTTRPRPPLH